MDVYANARKSCNDAASRRSAALPQEEQKSVQVAQK
jgi:hypothetical protein